MTSRPIFRRSRVVLITIALGTVLSTAIAQPVLPLPTDVVRPMPADIVKPMPKMDVKQGVDLKQGMDIKPMMMAVHDKLSAMKPSGDTDVDFAMMMRVHHQAAIMMAEAELQNGKDPQMRVMAKDIIRAQKKEVATFDRFLAKTGK
ncbi:MAG: DUF305 domain-containing protein [Polaromonas sp.]|jgi:uncharacterized protein (DUF305 family)